MKRNKGITLIALVITIIVLLILAGVAISMLSGENGILRKAADAKTKTENAQKQEETTLSDMEVTTDFLTNNVKYKIRNGYMTGFTIGESVENVEKDLKEMGYEINSKYNTETKKDEPITDKINTKIATGMKVEKNKQEVARVVLFGDVNCDSFIRGDDSSVIQNYLVELSELSDFQKIAANVNGDDEINGIDSKYIEEYSVDIIPIDQLRYAYQPANMLRREYKEMQKYMEKVNQETNYKMEYNEETDTYTIKGITNGTTVKQLKDAMPENDTISIAGYKPADDTPICNKHYIIKKVSKTVQTENGDVVYSTNTKIIIEI